MGSKVKWVTTAKYTDGKVCFYYDFPSDQDLTDGRSDKNKEMAFEDPLDGSDCSFIREPLVYRYFRALVNLLNLLGI